MGLRAVSVSGLKNNPAEALRQAKTGLVVVLIRDTPDALLMGLERVGLLQAPGGMAAQATVLCRDGELSVTRAGGVAGIDRAFFLSHLSRLGIAAISLTAAETQTDLDNLEHWLRPWPDWLHWFFGLIRILREVTGEILGGHFLGSAGNSQRPVCPQGEIGLLE